MDKNEFYKQELSKALDYFYKFSPRDALELSFRVTAALGALFIKDEYVDEWLEKLAEDVRSLKKFSSSDRSETR